MHIFADDRRRLGIVRFVKCVFTFTFLSFQCLLDHVLAENLNSLDSFFDFPLICKRAKPLYQPNFYYSNFLKKT